MFFVCPYTNSDSLLAPVPGALCNLMNTAPNELIFYLRPIISAMQTQHKPTQWQSRLFQHVIMNLHYLWQDGALSFFLISFLASLGCRGLACLMHNKFAWLFTPFLRLGAFLLGAFLVISISERGKWELCGKSFCRVLPRAVLSVWSVFGANLKGNFSFDRESSPKISC